VSREVKRESSGENVNTKIVIWLLATTLLTSASSTQAQQQPKVPRVGILFMGGKDQPHLETLKKGLSELGYSEGKNIILEYRYAEGRNDRLQELAKEFVRDKVDVIVTTSTISAQAARQATKTIPIVLTSGSRCSKDSPIVWRNPAKT
jgi:putative tryptophan/tyrosine transport system substrate-binding protein